MRQTAVFLCVLFTLAVAFKFATAVASPDGGESHPVPGPGLSYGGIPYGSMSGNVAEFFKRQAAPSGRSSNFASYSPNGVDYSHIQQWL